jgi:hypothetical protein
MTSTTIWTLLAVIIGGGISVGGQVILELVRDRRKAEQLSHAIAGEISALLLLVDGRRYVEAIQEHHALARVGTAMLLRVRIEQTYFSVIEANLQNIGLLPAELPLLIPKFLILSKSALEDFGAIRAGDWDGKAAAELAPMYEGLRHVIVAATTTGRQIVTLVATIYGSPHGRYPFRMFHWWWIALIFVAAGAVIDVTEWLSRTR